MKRPVEHDPNTLRLEGPAPVVDIAKDLVKRGVILAPIGIVIGAVLWQSEGAYSVAYGLALVAINFLMAAFMLAYAGQISAAAMGAAAVFGFFTRLSIITVAVLVVREAAWVNLVALGLTLVIAHVGLLFWEMRYISGSLANPGLKPTTKLPINHASSPEAPDSNLQELT